jgi:hypothetical protein
VTSRVSTDSHCYLQLQILRDAKTVPGQRSQSVDMGSFDEEQFMSELQMANSGH